MSLVVRPCRAPFLGKVPPPRTSVIGQPRVAAVSFGANEGDAVTQGKKLKWWQYAIGGAIVIPGLIVGVPIYGAYRGVKKVGQVTGICKPKAVNFEKDSQEFRVSAHELGHALIAKACGVNIQAIKVDDDTKLDEDGLTRLGFVELDSDETRYAFDPEKRKTGYGGLRAAFCDLAGYVLEDWASLETVDNINQYFEENKDDIIFRMKSSDMDGASRLLGIHNLGKGWSEKMGIPDFLPAQNLGDFYGKVMTQGEKIIKAIGKEKYQAMTQDLANKKELKTPKQVEAFFTKHLGKNYDWKPIQQLIDATFT